MRCGEFWPCDFGPDLSRGFRALKVWFTLKTYGLDALGEVIGRTCALAQALAHYELSSGVAGRLLHHALEARALDIVGTGKRHQHATRAQQFESTQVDFFVATQGLGEGIAAVGE